MANDDRDGEPGGERVARLYGLLRPHLDERQRRLLLGAQALELGRGGIKAVAAATGAHPDTVARGVREAAGGPEPRVRAPGGGRKKLSDTDPGLGPALMALVEPESRGDPESPLRWTCLSTRNLAGTLTAAGHACSAPTAARLLRAEGYSLQGNAKVAEGRQHPDRDAQFRYIAARASEHLDAGQPVISVDAKKKEQVGDFANGGSEWRPKGHPERVQCPRLPLRRDRQGDPVRHLRPGRQHRVGQRRHRPRHRRVRRGVAPPLVDGAGPLPGARRLLITADAGGSNGCPDPGLEGRARRAGRRDRAGDHRAATSRPAPNAVA